ncbi:MAG: hypothetical protein IE909_10725 [Campylobacterales bacterium]|nr:hypothetical protein [Campylobacterota bacterium]MBD3842341.1 hypothetical protein [Campylobacterales bacterium]
MNTAVKIKSCSRASASAKVAYNEERTKNKNKDIVVLEKNDMPPSETLSVADKKKIQALQKKISQSEKRLQKAIFENKEKSIKTNQKNLEEAKKELDKYQNRQDKREKYFTEFTIALTNSHDENYDPDWAKKTLEYIKKEFKELDVISAVEHKDQHSPHMHILMHSKEKPVTQVIAAQTGQKDTSREIMKEAYSAIQHNFHKFANENIAHNELKTLQKGRKYVSLGQYKQKGNFEAKNALRDKKQDLNYLFEKRSKLNNLEHFINRKLSYRNTVKFDVIDRTKTVLFGLATESFSFVTIEDIEIEKRKQQENLKDFEKFGIDTTKEAKEINKHFDYLLTLKRSKEKKYEYDEVVQKEEVIKINKERLNEFLKSLNSNIHKLYEKLIDVQEKIKKELNSVKEKISIHPKTIESKQRELELKEQREKTTLEREQQLKQNEQLKQNRNRVFRR